MGACAVMEYEQVLAVRSDVGIGPCDCIVEGFNGLGCACAPGVLSVGYADRGEADALVAYVGNEVQCFVVEAND